MSLDRLDTTENRPFPSLSRQGKILAFGDVHGRMDLLAQIHARIDEQYDPAEVLEIYLGDYIDRGPASRDVIDALIERRMTKNVIYLAGNHEEMFLHALDGRQIPGWAALGGRETAFSYGVKPGLLSSLPPEEVAQALREAVPEAHVSFFRDLELWYRDGDYIFVHAGLRPGAPLEHQSRRDLLWIREPFLSYRRSFGGLVVHGHTPVREPDFRANRINIDTGAYMSSRLTALAISRTGATVIT